MIKNVIHFVAPATYMKIYVGSLLARVLQQGNIFTDDIINSFPYHISRWTTEITNRLINNYFEEIKQ